MVKRNHANKRRGPKRYKTSTIPVEYVARGVLSPASTVTVKQDNFPSLVKGSPFRIGIVVIQFSAVDVATANKQTFGNVLLQCRQLQSTSTIKSSRTVMAGTNPKSLRFRGTNLLYPAGYSGSVIAIDCLCPSVGSEIGCWFHLSIKFLCKPTFESETCPTLYCYPTSDDFTKREKPPDDDDSQSLCSSFSKSIKLE